jgi:hypothetical protein
MGVDPLHRSHFADQMHGLLLVVLGLKGVVGRQGHGGQPASDAGGTQEKGSAHRHKSPELSKSPLASYIIGVGG